MISKDTDLIAFAFCKGDAILGWTEENGTVFWETKGLVDEEEVRRDFRLNPLISVQDFISNRRMLMKILQDIRSSNPKIG